jgi:putative intracellular protease/amidase
MAQRILIILTSNNLLGDTGENTGFHFQEMSDPYYIFTDAGIAVDIASTLGGTPETDPSSFEEGKDKETVKRFLVDDEAISKLENTLSIKDIDVSTYDAVYFPGGHGTMWDFPNNPRIKAIVEEAYRSGKVIGAVCHGPAALVDAVDSEGNPIVRGKIVNCFTDDEETAIDLAGVMPFLLESRLTTLGATFEKAPNFEPFIAVDGNLVTGQNPASASPLAEKMLSLING